MVAIIGRSAPKRVDSSSDPSSSDRPDTLTPLQGSPIGQTFAFSATAVALFLLLGMGTGEAGLAFTDEWAAWRVVAAFGCTLGMGASVIGWRLLKVSYRDADDCLGPDHRAPARPAALAAAALFVLCVGVFLDLAASTELRSWSLPGMRLRTGAVIVLLGGSLTPWVAMVWHVHHRAIRLRCVNGRPTPPGRPAVDATEMDHQHRLWMMLRYCVVAFAGFMVIALVQTGALRSLWQMQATMSGGADRFTSADVLLYGGFLAAVMGCLVVPLLTAWKGQAELIVDRHYPLSDFRCVPPADDKWIENRDRLNKFLHLDVSVLRSPLTMFSVFTPLVVSLLAVFVPELAG